MDPIEALASNSFCRVADAQASNGNQFRLLKDGPETFAAWLAAIGGAKRYVYLENYILQEDATGESFAAALIAAAARGAKCLVLHDWLGCVTRTSSKFWAHLRSSGVEVRQYNPPHLSNPLGWISRDHRKVLCVDGDVAFTGGLCIGHDWAGDPARGIPPWRDTAVELRGPAIQHIEAAFADSWSATGGDLTLPPSAPASSGGAEVLVVPGRPDSMGLYRLEQLIAEMAQHSLWLTDGYFVATTAYVRALSGAARAGVDVRLLVPGTSNWPLVGALSKSAYRPLLQAGVRIFEWNGPMVHAKTAVADSCWARIGSSNSNLASWISNRELDVTIKDHGLAQQMMAMFEADMGNSTEVLLADGNVRRAAGTRHDRSPVISARRLFSGAIGLGSTLTASFSHRRVLQPGESPVVLSGGLALLLLGGCAILFPHVVAWMLAVALIWPAMLLLAHAFKLWRAG
jgi:cardiolipin synthase